jgi:hypothetical protein
MEVDLQATTRRLFEPNSGLFSNLEEMVELTVASNRVGVVDREICNLKYPRVRDHALRHRETHCIHRSEMDNSHFSVYSSSAVVHARLDWLRVDARQETPLVG